MLHFPMVSPANMEFPTNSDNVMIKYAKYIAEECKLFTRYNNILHTTLNTLITNKFQGNDNHNTLTISVMKLLIPLDMLIDEKANSKYTIRDGINMLLDYLAKFRTPEYLNNIYFIRDALKLLVELFPKDNTYSIHNAANIIKRTTLDANAARSFLIQMLFARDFLNYKDILVIRNYLINSQSANKFYNFRGLNKNPGNDVLSIFFSDCELIPSLVEFGDLLFTHNEVLFSEMLLEEDGKFYKNGFDYICAVAYGRFLLTICIFVMEADISNYFKDEIIKQGYSRILRLFSLYIFATASKNMSIAEIICFSNIEIINDILGHINVITSFQKLEKSRALLSSVAATSGHKNFDNLINKIIKIVNKKLDNGCKYTHAQMLKHFKNSPEFSKYFKKKSENRGFERALRKAIIETYQQRGLPIVGTNGVSIGHSPKEDNKLLAYLSSLFSK